MPKASSSFRRIPCLARDLRVLWTFFGSFGSGTFDLEDLEEEWEGVRKSIPFGSGALVLEDSEEEWEGVRKSFSLGACRICLEGVPLGCKIGNQYLLVYVLVFDYLWLPIAAHLSSDLG